MKKWSSWVAEKLWWKELAVEAWWVPTGKVGFCPGMKKLQICDVAERVDRLGKKKGQLKKSSPREAAASLRIWSAKCSSSRISISLVQPPAQQQLKIGKESRFAAAGSSHGHALDALSLWRHHVAVLHNILLLLLAHEALAHPRGSDQFLDPSLGYHPCSSSSWLLTAATASCQYSPRPPLSLLRDHRRVSASCHSKCTFLAY